MGRNREEARLYAIQWRKNPANSEWHKLWRNFRRRTKKIELLRQLGGKCVDCGFDKNPEALDFDHVDPSTKSFGIGPKLHLNQNSLIREASKCVIRCANCHRIKTVKLQREEYEKLASRRLEQASCKWCGELIPMPICTISLRRSQSKYCSESCNTKWQNNRNLVRKEKDKLRGKVSQLLFKTEGRSPRSQKAKVWEVGAAMLLEA